MEKYLAGDSKDGQRRDRKRQRQEQKNNEAAFEYKIKKRRQRTKVDILDNPDDYDDIDHPVLQAVTRKLAQKRKKKAEAFISGRVLSYTGGYYMVDGPDGQICCFLRGMLKKALRASHQPVVVGDSVKYKPIPAASAPDKEATAVIVEVLPRKRKFRAWLRIAKIK